MKIVVNNQIHLSEFRPSDKPALTEHLNDYDIYDRTLRIPFPYTEADADEWLALVPRIVEEVRAEQDPRSRPQSDDAVGVAVDGHHAQVHFQATIGTLRLFRRRRLYENTHIHADTQTTAKVRAGMRWGSVATIVVAGAVAAASCA
jgi:hypothetical protein